MSRSTIDSYNNISDNINDSIVYPVTYKRYMSTNTANTYDFQQYLPPNPTSIQSLGVAKSPLLPPV